MKQCKWVFRSSIHKCRNIFFKFISDINNNKNERFKIQFLSRIFFLTHTHTHIHTNSACFYYNWILDGKSEKKKFSHHHHHHSFPRISHFWTEKKVYSFITQTNKQTKEKKILNQIFIILETCIWLMLKDAKIQFFHNGKNNNKNECEKKLEAINYRFTTKKNDYFIVIWMEEVCVCVCQLGVALNVKLFFSFVCKLIMINTLSSVKLTDWVTWKIWLVFMIRDSFFSVKWKKRKEKWMAKKKKSNRIFNDNDKPFFFLEEKPSSSSSSICAYIHANKLTNKPARIFIRIMKCPKRR